MLRIGYWHVVGGALVSVSIVVMWWPYLVKCPLVEGINRRTFKLCRIEPLKPKCISSAGRVGCVLTLCQSACRRPECCPTWRVCREEVCSWLTAPPTVRWRWWCHDQQVSCQSRLLLKEYISCFSLQPTSTFSTRRSSSSTWSRSEPTTACRYAAAVCDTPLKIWAAESKLLVCSIRLESSV